MSGSTFTGPLKIRKSDDTRVTFVDADGNLVAGTDIKFDDGDYLSDTNGNELVLFAVTSSAVNEITVTNAATGNAPSVTATGDDTNIDLELQGKGTGAVTIAGTVGLKMAEDTPILDANGNELVDFTKVTNAVNYIEVTNAVTTDSPVIAAAGSDTNIDLELSAKGTGGIKLTNTEDFLDANGNEILQFEATASAVNHIHVTNDATGSAPDIAAVGDDTNIDLGLSSKGTGCIDFKLPTKSTSSESVTASGALSLITSQKVIDSTSGVQALTLADGVSGQEMFLVMTVDGGDSVVTPANMLNGTTITFDDVGDSAHLVFMATGWVYMGGTATVA